MSDSGREKTESHMFAPDSRQETKPQESKLDKLLKMHDHLCRSAHEIFADKNKDYADDRDPFANFTGSEVLDIHPILGVLLRMQDKMSRIKNFVKNGKLHVKGENVDNAILDIINYSIIIAGIVKRDNPNMIPF